MCLLAAGNMVLWAAMELTLVLLAVLVFLRWQARRTAGPSYAELKFRVEALEAQLVDAKRDAAVARAGVVKHASL
jgi:ABC-type transport system involved in cytochrome bd biosynthesis fused ATPase/permease subunit